MTYTRRNKGTCSMQTTVELAPDGTILDVNVQGGCNGNLQGIGRLVEGMPVDEVISRLRGIRCGYKTSCPDQVAQCLKEALEQL